jgi:hypothetical protein
MVAKHSFSVEVGCRSSAEFFEDEYALSLPETPVSPEYQNLSLRESRTNTKPSFKVPFD